MKKLALIIAIAGIVGLSSCSKSGTECKYTVSGVTTTVTVDEGVAKTCVLTICSETELGTTSDADYVKSLEDAGYTCK